MNATITHDGVTGVPYTYHILHNFFFLSPAQLQSFPLLSSRAPIHSSSSSSLLFILSSVFLISFIVFFVSDFFKIFLRVSLMSYSFLKSSEYLYDHYFKFPD